MISEPLFSFPSLKIRHLQRTPKLIRAFFTAASVLNFNNSAKLILRVNQTAHAVAEQHVDFL